VTYNTNSNDTVSLYNKNDPSTKYLQGASLGLSVYPTYANKTTVTLANDGFTITLNDANISHSWWAFE
jgi:uncharacterized membrane protein